MKQDNQPQNIDGQRATAEQIAMAKAKQKADALKRSKTNTRRTSQASTSNEQSQVTEQPPVMYQVPNISVPDNLHDCAKLIQGELAKIAQSQSVLLTLYERIQGKSAFSQDGATRAYIIPNPITPAGGFEFCADSAHETYLDFKLDNGDSDYAARIIANSADTTTGRAQLTMFANHVNINCPSKSPCLTTTATRYLVGGTGDAWTDASSAVFNMAKFPFESTAWHVGGQANNGQWSLDMNDAPTGASFFAYTGVSNAPPIGGPCLSWYGLNAGYQVQLVGSYSSGGALHFRTANGDAHTWNPWHTLATTAALVETRAALKLEIYAELATLNAGFVVPVVIPDNE